MGDYWKRRIVFTGSNKGVLTSVLAFQIHHGNLYMWLTGGAIGGAWGGQYFMILDPHGNLVAAEHMDYGNLGADDVRQLRRFAVDPNGQVWQLAVTTKAYKSGTRHSGRTPPLAKPPIPAVGRGRRR
jgi:hypothetical protein